MTTAAQFRKLALSMPETEEKSHFEQPDFRVKGKIFCGLSRDGETANLKLTPELQAMVLSDAAFTPAAGAWGRSGWTHVLLRAVELEALRDLVREAWRIVAPKKLHGAVAPDAARDLAKRTPPEKKSPRQAKTTAPQKVSAKPRAMAGPTKKRPR